MIDTNDYLTAHYHESSGSLGDIGLKVLVALSYQLNEEQKREVSRMSEEIYKYLLRTQATSRPGFETDKEEIVRELKSCFPENQQKICVDVPNKYCLEPCCLHRPWLVVSTSRGRFQIGWRKRVIHIEWFNTNLPTAEMLFPNEDVTKYERTIHAWSLAKAKEYITTILESKEILCVS